MNLKLPAKPLMLTLGLISVVLLVVSAIFPEIYILRYLLCVNLMFTPGLLILRLINFKFSNLAELIFHSFSVSLGISLLLTLLLSVLKENFIFPDLNSQVIFLSYAILLVPLTIFQVLLRPAHLIRKYDFNFFKVLSVFYFAVPFLSILATNYLNVSGEGKYVSLLLAFILLALSFVTIFQKKIGLNTSILVIYLSTLAILFSYTFRSPYISGYDIHSENLVYKETINRGYWSPFTSNVVYNSCLGITALPFVINSVTGLNSDQIFKILFPLLFSFVPLGLYLYLLKVNGIGKNLAMLSTFYFIAQKQLILQMSAIGRQEIAFVFFISLLLILFNTKQKLSGWFLLIFYSFCLITSHYSTNYVTIGLLVLAWIIKIFFPLLMKGLNYATSLISHAKREYFKAQKISSHIYLSFILVFFAITYSWVVLVNNSYQNVESVINRTTSSISLLLSDDFRSGIFQEIVLRDHTLKSTSTNEFNQHFKDQYAVQKGGIVYYPDDLVSGYQVNNISYPAKQISNLAAYGFFSQINGLVILLAKILPFIGGILLFIDLSIKRREDVSPDYILFTLASLIFLAAFVILPLSTVGYNIERLFQQLLFFLSLATLIPLAKLSKLVVKSPMVFPLLFVFCYALSDAGFGLLLNFSGGNSYFNFNNFGSDYEKFYTHEQEISSLDWMQRNINTRDKIFIDAYSQLKSKSYTNLEPSILLKDILPVVIGSNNYVYSSWTNTLLDTTFISYQNTTYRVNYPTQFLEENKNTVYSNRFTKVYR